MNRFLASAMTFCLATAALAQEAGKTAAPGGPAPAGGGTPVGPFGNPLLMIGIIIIMFYFMLWRPQKAEQRKREELLNSVGKGDKVVTGSGIFGTVESVDSTKGTVMLTIAPKVTIKVSRAAITNVEEKKKGGKEEAEASAQS
jgi:preprotein translocase subunit YajC